MHVSVSRLADCIVYRYNSSIYALRCRIIQVLAVHAVDTTFGSTFALPVLLFGHTNKLKIDMWSCGWLRGRLIQVLVWWGHRTTQLGIWVICRII